MWNLIKTLFRYSFKRKSSLFATLIFTFFVSASFSSLMILSSNLQNSYNKLVDNGNLNNVVAYELYSSTVKEDNKDTPDIDETKLTGDDAKEYNKKMFLSALDKKIGNQNWRRFKSIDYNGTSSGNIYKLVENNLEYTINKLVMYDGNNLLPQTFHFTKIIENANWTKDLWQEHNAPSKNISIDERNEIIYHRRLFLYLLTKMKWTDDTKVENNLKLIEANNNVQSIKDFNNPDGDPKQSKFVNTNLKKNLNIWLQPDLQDNLTRTSDKICRFTIQFSAGLIPVVGYIDNFSSYSVVVPNYVLENQKVEILPQHLYQKLVDFNNIDNADQDEFETWFKSKELERYKIKIDNLELMVLGSGMTPDFMYPVFDFAHATPNVKTEVIAYGNNAAYNLIWDANRSAPVDDYLLLRVNNLNSTTIKELNELARNYMAWPSNVNAVYDIYDTNNKLSPIALRVSFPPKLIDMQIGLSNTMSLFIGILTCIIFLFIVKKFIYDNKDSLAVLRANGFKKRWIVWSMPVLSLIPTIFGSLFGYLFGQFSQSLFISLYSSYWIIPITTTIFSPLIFFGLLTIPLIIMSILSVINSYLVFKKNTKELMSESSRFKISPLAISMGKIFKKANVMTRFKTSIAFSSLSKLIAITIMFTLFSMGTIFSIALTGKFEYIKSATFDNKKYNYAVDLMTPTIQGGAYIPQKFKDLGKPLISSRNEILNFNTSIVDDKYNKIRGQDKTIFNYLNQDLSTNNNLTQAIFPLDSNSKVTLAGNNSLVHAPSLNDSEWQQTQINYLKYRIETPFILDCNIGLGAASTNPWNIARALMPTNAITKCNEMSQQLWEKILNDEHIYFKNDEKLLQYKEWLGASQYNKITASFVNYPLNEIFINEKFLTKIVDNDESSEALWNSTNIFDRIYRDENGTKSRYIVNRSKISSIANLPLSYSILSSFVMTLDDYQSFLYKVLYNYIVIEESDETYTNVKASIINSGSNDEITLKGIKPDTKYIDLVDGKGNKVNDKLKLDNNLEEKYKSNIHGIYKDNNFNSSNNFKLIINRSAAYQYDLSVGSKLRIKPIETATRYNPRSHINSSDVIDLSQFNTKEYDLTVVGIIDTFQNPEFYVNQRIANLLNNMHLDPILKTSYYNDYIFDNRSWRDIGVKVYEIDPWNGFFSSVPENSNISVNTTLYSESSIMPPFDKITFENSKELILTALKSKLSDLNKRSDQANYLAKIDLARALGYVDKNTMDVTLDSIKLFEANYSIIPNDNNHNDQIIKEIINLIISQYGDSPVLSSVYNVEYVEMFSQIFDNISKFARSLMALVLVIIYVISSLTIVLLSIDFISSSIALCSILKAIGFYDRTNAFNFLSMLFPAAILSVVIGIPLSILMFEAITKFIYGFSTIYVPLPFLWWYGFINLGILLGIIGIVVGFAIWNLKKQNITRSISGF